MLRLEPRSELATKMRSSAIKQKTPHRIDDSGWWWYDDNSDDDDEDGGCFKFSFGLDPVHLNVREVIEYSEDAIVASCSEDSLRWVFDDFLQQKRVAYFCCSILLTKQYISQIYRRNLLDVIG